MNVKELILGGEDYHGPPHPEYYNWLKGEFHHWPRRQKVDNNTWLDVQNPDTPDELLTVILHATPIITIDPRAGTATVQAGKWHTDVTAARLNDWLPPIFRVYLRTRQPRQLCWDVVREAEPGHHPQVSRWRNRQGAEAQDIYLSDGDSVDYREGALHTLNVSRPAPAPPVQEGKKKKKPWDSTKGIFAATLIGDYSKYPGVKWYRRCAKCGSTFGMFKTPQEAQLNNYCHSCYLNLMDKMSKEVAELTGRR